MGKQCKGCKDEMEMCYYYQNQEGVVAGLDWYDLELPESTHCLMFALDEITGEQIAW